MRWDELRLGDPGLGGSDRPTDAAHTGATRAVPLLPLALAGPRADTVRRIDTPGFAGVTFYEIQARSIINKVPAASRVPFSWTINPYRGCTHACVYCFARNTHTYLDLDVGHDFDSQIVVKVNAGELLRKELGAPRWTREPIAMGTNVDVYQRAEGRYRLMPAIIAALRDFANPFSILTKGTLILRDLPLLCEAATVTDVSLAMSVGSIDEAVWRSAEPGTPAPRRRLDAVRTLADAGFRVTVLMAPILPGLTDSEASVDATVSAIAAAGAARVVPLPLHLRPGAREWYLAWLAREHPDALERYRRLYGSGSYLPAAEQRAITARVRQAARRHGLLADSDDSPMARASTSRATPDIRQESLF